MTTDDPGTADPMPVPEIPEIMGELAALGKIYDQESIAWAVAPETIML